MTNRLEDFNEYRSRMNDRISEIDHLGIKRFFNLDTAAYRDGPVDSKTKELLGLVASTVLRCNDCISFHIAEAVSAGVAIEEITEALGIALVVGGSITIPHVRHAYEVLASIEQSG